MIFHLQTPNTIFIFEIKRLFNRIAKIAFKTSLARYLLIILIGNKQGEKTDQNLLKVNGYSRKTSFTKWQFF